ncbi:hypothetical protein ACFHW2_36540 [Actinomadura sp. LOL_016]|uniref:hypothetical protein n=1 Tax=unclassified Actinomadura TaxID=2626254 RepID=UPI003A80C23D
MLLLLSYVLAMHGVQASPSPVETHGIPLTVTGVERHHSETKASAGHHSPTDHKDDHRQDHPGGQLCLAMLTMLVLVWALLVVRRRTRTVWRCGRWSGR